MLIAAVVVGRPRSSRGENSPSNSASAMRAEVFEPESRDNSPVIGRLASRGPPWFKAGAGRGSIRKGGLSGFFATFPLRNSETELYTCVWSKPKPARRCGRVEGRRLKARGGRKLYHFATRCGARFRLSARRRAKPTEAVSIRAPAKANLRKSERLVSRRETIGFAARAINH